MPTLLLRGGRVVPGDGQEPRRADVLAAGERITPILASGRLTGALPGGGLRATP